MRTVTSASRSRVGMLLGLPAIAGVLSGCVAAAPTRGSTAPPSGVELVALEDSHDFGTVDNGPVVSRTFKLKNYGPDTIRIKSVKTACGWTARLASTPGL